MAALHQAALQLEHMAKAVEAVEAKVGCCS